MACFPTAVPMLPCNHIDTVQRGSFYATVVRACIPTRACAMSPAHFSQHAIFPTHSSAAVENRAYVDITFFTWNNVLQLQQS